MTKFHRILTLTALAASFSGAHAANFCVATSAQLQQALDAAGSNSEDDVIKISQGSYSVASGSVAFAYATATSHAITVEGGFQTQLGAVCGARTNDASLTVLSGSGVRQVARFSPGPGTNGEIEIKNLSIQGGFSATQSGAGLTIGGVGSYTGNITIERVIFENNFSDTFGGGLNVGSDGGFVYVLGNLFLKNRCMGNFCAALATVNASSQATARAFFGNNTFIDNRCGEGAPATCTAGGVRIGGSARMQFFNNVFAPGAITGSNLTISATPVEVNFNNIYSVVGTPPQLFLGNVSAADPLFVNAANNFRLSAASGLRNIGGFIEGNASLDLDGKPRVDASALIDMGAYEFHPDLLLANGFE